MNEDGRRLVSTEARLTALALLRAALENRNPEGKDLPTREIATRVDAYLARAEPLLDPETGDPNASTMAAMGVLVAMMTSIGAGALEAIAYARYRRHATSEELLAGFAQFEEGFLLGRTE